MSQFKILLALALALAATGAGAQSWTLRQCIDHAKRQNISRSYVSRLEKKALEKMKHKLEKE